MPTSTILCCTHTRALSNWCSTATATNCGARLSASTCPLDLARVATDAGLARGNMYGGFSLTLSPKKHRPAIQIKHLSSRAALIRFAAPFKPRDGRSLRRRGRRTPIRRGFFVDVNTLAFALFSKPFSLESLCAFLKIPAGKLRTEEHGGRLTPEYIAYAVRDTEATWACYAELRRRYDTLGLPTPVSRIYSEASIGKGYLAAMGVKPWQEVQPDVLPQLLAQILSTYFGGRSEVRIRRELARVVLCDFLSMYPTVNALMGLWRF